MEICWSQSCTKLMSVIIQRRAHHQNLNEILFYFLIKNKVPLITVYRTGNCHFTRADSVRPYKMNYTRQAPLSKRWSIGWIHVMPRKVPMKFYTSIDWSAERKNVRHCAMKAFRILVSDMKFKLKIIEIKLCRIRPTEKCVIFFLFRPHLKGLNNFSIVFFCVLYGWKSIL